MHAFKKKYFESKIFVGNNQPVVLDDIKNKVLT